MAAWPAISAPSFPLEETVLKPQIRTEFEAGYVQSRPRATRARRAFRLTWRVMTQSDWDTLAAFFVANIGGTFSWTNPEDSTAYTVRFSDDELRSTILSNGLRSVIVELEQD